MIDFMESRSRRGVGCPQPLLRRHPHNRMCRPVRGTREREGSERSRTRSTDRERSTSRLTRLPILLRRERARRRTELRGWPVQHWRHHSPIQPQGQLCPLRTRRPLPAPTSILSGSKVRVGFAMRFFGVPRSFCGLDPAPIRLPLQQHSRDDYRVAVLETV